jgi:hypothetical protein
MENHDSRIAHSPEASTDERASFVNPQPASGGCYAAPEAAPEHAAIQAPPFPRPADSRFASEAEERAYWAGVRIGMENAAAARAAHAAHAAAPCPEPPPLLSDTLSDVLSERIADSVEASFPPGGRKPRHDGFTPAKMGEFLRYLAATGVVEHAAAAVQISPAAAYALRNRRQGRAFARMWDAILINRARDRLASELSSRAIAGCVSIRKKDGLIVSEYHHYDNRLAMSVLARLDRLAEKEGPGDAHLRALSEDMEEFIDCLAVGDDPDAFVERRRPVPPPEPEPAAPAPDALPTRPRAAAAAEASAAAEEDPFPDVATFARACGVPDRLGTPPHEIPVADLDPADRQGWDPDQFVRFYRSGFAAWLVLAQDVPLDEDRPDGLAATLQFDTSRRAVAAARAVYGSTAAAGADEPIETADLIDAPIEDWSEEQLARAWRSGLVGGLPLAFWQLSAGLEPEEEEEEEDLDALREE